MVEKEQMPQTCMTELSELCEKLANDFGLSRHSENGRIVLQGDTYSISHEVEADGYEKIGYRNTAITAAFSEDNHARYIVKGKYLSDQKIVLGETGLGRRILRKLGVIVARHKFTDEQINRIGLKADVMYLNNDEVYDFIKSHIFT